MNKNEIDYNIKILKEMRNSIKSKEDATNFLKKVGIINDDGSLSENYYTEEQIEKYEKREK